MHGKLVKVLLVDDDEDQYIITRDLLEEAKGLEFELDWVSNYAEGVKTLLLNKHDICFLDYRLGGQNGIELLNEISGLDCKVPIVMLTGEGCHDVDISAMQAGAADYLSKDEISPQLLDRSIRYAAARRRAENERINSERLQTMLATAGAACHELNQPLQAVLGNLELLMDTTQSQGLKEIATAITEILGQARKIAEVTRKMQSVVRYETKEYADGAKIIDLNAATQNAGFCEHDSA